MVAQVELNDIVELSDSIIVYNNGKSSEYGRNTLIFKQVIEGWRIVTKNAEQMPAFGVSLNSQTLKARTSGLWFEFIFDREYTNDDMPFERLLINLEREWCGFNIIRYTTKDGYDGRCFYYDLLGENANYLYDILLNL